MDQKREKDSYYKCLWENYDLSFRESPVVPGGGRVGRWRQHGESSSELNPKVTGLPICMSR